MKATSWRNKPSSEFRRGRPPAAALSNPDLPYTMKLPDGRTLYVEVPGRWVGTDRSGKPALRPKAVAFLDRIRALAMPLDRPPSPGYITALREALGLTQQEFGILVPVDGMTVSRWERGALHPSVRSLKALERVRSDAVKRGVAIPS